ncbi:MAG: thymidine phosphorylase [Bifidobacteriaceae bacterium]|jgi:pyrimidine-nucleoside phosphorylase|nr:thymidine phosphorylase [Bifidobacteriaceae bacterium]
MNTVDIINKVVLKKELTDEEISYFVKQAVNGDIPDYQVSAFLMAVRCQNLSNNNTSVLTREMEFSGDVVDLSGINGVKLDKHSTGGVGDKASLIIVPLVAACGGKVAKLSGRGLGHTGGTIDKLESIPGFNTEISITEFIEIVNSLGGAIIGATGNLVPADKMFYALRDVTASVESIPLIASSIMSKKLASGADAILLDVKCGSGAFMKTPEAARELAEVMIHIGKDNGRKMAAFITNMDIPLGHNIGNALEVEESIRTLKNDGPDDLTHECVQAAGVMLYLGGVADSPEDGENMAKESLANGKAFAKFREIVQAQGGDLAYIDDTAKLLGNPKSYDVISLESGFINKMDTLEIGMSSVMLKAGRETKTDKLDYYAGITIYKKTGDEVKKGEKIARLYAQDESLFKAAEKRFLSAFKIQEKIDKENIWPLMLHKIV